MTPEERDEMIFRNGFYAGATSEGWSDADQAGCDIHKGRECDEALAKEKARRGSLLAPTPAPLTEGAAVKNAGRVLRNCFHILSQQGRHHEAEDCNQAWMRLQEAGEVEDGPRPGGGEAKTPRGDAASGWDSNQAAQAMATKLAEAKTLMDKLRYMVNMGCVHGETMKRVDEFLVTPEIPGEGERA